MIHKLIIYLLLFASCASIQSLEGGLTDTQAPKVLSQQPDSAALNVSKNKITITFDEYIKTQDFNNLLLLSPSQNTQPTIHIKGKIAEITLNDSLAPNTTYTLQINGSIVDNNEGNPLDHKIVFSTGAYIDSLTYSGFVINSYTNATCEDCNVYLYLTAKDSAILTQKPDYISKTNKAGRYEFTNLPLTQFRVIAIQDANKNLLLDKLEHVSLYKNITPNTSITDTLYIFPYSPYETCKFKILKESNKGYLKLSSSVPVSKDYSFYINDELIHPIFNRLHDTLILLNNSDFDTTAITIISPTDTSQLKYISDNSPFVSTIQIVNHSETKIQLTANQNISSFDATKISITNDTLPITPDSITLSQNQINLFTNLNRLLPTTIIIATNFITFNKNTNPNDTLSINPIKDSDPKLTLNITHHGLLPYIIEITQKERIVHSLTTIKDTIININHLPSGIYNIKIIKDGNKNGLWDTGNPIDHSEPESILFLLPFELRNNWDKELIINDIHLY